MNEETNLEDLIEKVQANSKYKSILHSFVKRLSTEALAKGLTGKTAVKEVRNRLHQVGNAYFKRNINFVAATDALETLPQNLKSEEVQRFCLKHMGAHASTAERLRIMNDFYQTTLAPLAPLTSILDLACGLNPLAIAWMPLSENCTYRAYDIYLDMMAFIQSFFDHFSIQGNAHPCDILDTLPKQHAQVAFLLKSLPCLEQLDKDIGSRFFERVNADHILISFPVRSLGGRKKGMPGYYHDHFYNMAAGKSWAIQEFAFETELAFLVSK
jgi:16S rRNA (guanine(1405)-N(7))-methyltransferase